MRKEVNSEFVK